MGKAMIALKSAPRRKLQVLAMEMKLCRGNAKSEVILSHAVQFLDDHPKDGEQQMLDVLNSIESTSPTAKAVGGKRAVKRDVEPEVEPEVCVKELKVTASKSASRETVQLTLADSKPKKRLKRKHAPSTTVSKKSTETDALPCESSSCDIELVTTRDAKKMKSKQMPSSLAVKKSKIKQISSPEAVKKSPRTTTSLAENDDSKKKLVTPLGTKKETAKSKKAPSRTVVKKAPQTTASSASSEANEVMPSDVKKNATKRKQTPSPTVAKKSKIEHTPSPTVVKKSPCTTSSAAKNASKETDEVTPVGAKRKNETIKRKQMPAPTVAKKSPTTTTALPAASTGSDTKLVTPRKKKKMEVQTPSPTVVKKSPSTTALHAASTSSETDAVTPALAKKKETLESKQTPSPTVVEKSRLTQILSPAAVKKSPSISASPAVSTSETNEVAPSNSKKKTTKRKQTPSPTLVKTLPSTTAIPAASTSSETNAVTPMDTKKNKTGKSMQRPSPPVSTKTSSSITSSAESSSLSERPLATSTNVLPAAINQRPTAAAKKVALVKPDALPSKNVVSARKKETEIKPRETVEALVQSTPDLTFIGDSRVRCSTTGHEMVADVDVINTYLQGKRYQKACNLKLSFAKYAPMFVDHPDELKTDMLWCNVTESAIARDEKRVNDHIGGSKYQSQLPIWKEQEAAKKKAEEAKEARLHAARTMAAKKRKLTGNAIGDNPARNKRRKRSTMMKSDK
uniref:Uncharacterized protein n=1 Tax=Peronospora matthiolae TaxID=2874970 RepID=A0AAV1V8T7_9STRA